MALSMVVATAHCPSDWVILLRKINGHKVLATTPIEA